MTKPLKIKPPKLRLVFICTGNTCRSPMAEYIFKAFLKEKKSAGKFAVSSAGLYAVDGDPMSEAAGRACLRLGITPEKHKARLLTVDIVQNADVMLCMTEAHRDALISSAAYAYASGNDSRRIVGTAAELIETDIPDPYGQNDETYLKAAKSIAKLCEPLYEALLKYKETIPKFNPQISARNNLQN